MGSPKQNALDDLASVAYAYEKLGNRLRWEMVYAHEAGASLRAIAAEVGRSPESVRTMIREEKTSEAKTTRKRPTLRKPTAADNIHAAHFYAGLASNVLPVFDRIPREELDQLLEEAARACEWWEEVKEELQAQKEAE